MSGQSQFWFKAGELPTQYPQRVDPFIDEIAGLMGRLMGIERRAMELAFMAQLASVGIPR